MIKFYTGETAKAFKNVKADVEFPENGLSPWEQVDWIKENWNRDITVLTFSPYILNYLNVLIAEGKLTEDNFGLWYMFFADEGIVKMDIKVHDGEGRLLVDTTDLSDPISYMYKQYNELTYGKTDN